MNKNRNKIEMKNEMKSEKKNTMAERFLLLFPAYAEKTDVRVVPAVQYTLFQAKALPY